MIRRVASYPGAMALPWVLAMVNCVAGAEQAAPTPAPSQKSVGALASAQKLAELSQIRRNPPSNSRGFVTVGSQVLFFSATEGTYGATGGLYRTDGTAAGTRLVRDLEELENFQIEPSITALGAIGYWFRDRTLWRSDGTAAGTSAIRTFAQSGTTPMALGDALYFSTGAVLWRSDGTDAGTVQLAALQATSNGRELGGKLYFGCGNATSGTELCVTDGTAAGTSIVKDLVPGIRSGEPIFLGVVGARLLFSAVDASSSLALRGLWSTDGTSAGTIRLLAPAPNGDVLTRFQDTSATLGGFAYFGCYTAATGSELCRTDGTVAGTSVLDLTPGAGSLGVGTPLALGGQLIMVRYTAAEGAELWRSDGTVAGTTMIVDLNPGAADGVDRALVRVGESVYFAARTSSFAHQHLWKTDGTAAGTLLVKAILPADKPQPYPLTLTDSAVLGDKLAFIADDGTTSNEPWVTDGTAAGTVRLGDLIPERADVSTLKPRAFMGAQYLTVDEASQSQAFALWRTNGTAAGTKLLHAGWFEGFAAMGPWLYYLGTGTTVRGLWRTDGLSDTVDPARHKVSELPGSASELLRVGDRLAFAGTTPNQATGLWLSDGTAAGTVLAPVLNARRLGVSNGKLWLTGLDGSLGNELWMSDGTVAGTRPVKDIRVGFGSSEPKSFTPLGANTLFVADDGVTGPELWRTDGTTAGTAAVIDLLPGASGSNPSNLLSWKNQVMFSASSSSTGPRELWKTDGTAAGTARIKAIAPLGPMLAWGDTVFFIAAEPLGTELWRTDGTEAGTVRVTDLPGPLAQNPDSLTLMSPSGPLVFAADDAATGRELWKLAQPLGAPELLLDLAPGPRSSRPVSLLPQGRALVVTADTGAGNALWRIDDVGPDGAAPVLQCPASFIKRTLDGTGTVVTFPAPLVSDDSGAAPVITVDPPSGRLLPLGVTTVEVTATDGSNNVSRCSFSVTVQQGAEEPPPEPAPDPDPSPKPGEQAGGCSAGLPATALLPLMLGALSIVRRRRRTVR